MRRYFEGETTQLPKFLADRVRSDLGPLYRLLPPGALTHNPLAYLGSPARGFVTVGEPRAAVQPSQAGV